jgi:RNA polymerase sigma factor (TIGR02999 family)
MTEPGDITRLLADSRAGDRGAFDRLYAVVYDELRSVARRQLRAPGAGRTLSTTVLIHEAYVRMAGQTRVDWKDRAHFYGYAARAMRAVLVDYARRRGAAKRGGDRIEVRLADADVAIGDQIHLVLELDQALTRLRELDERLVRVVECQFFGGLSQTETAEALGLTERTVRRDWVKARAWLFAELRTDDADPLAAAASDA